MATFTTTALLAGTSSITATYGGDTNYAASTSPSVAVNITQATTTAALSFSPASPVLDQDVTLTATITPATTGPVSPSGTVEFFDGSTLLGDGTVSNGAATLTTTALSLGANTITATYEGDSNYVASTSPAITVTVVQTGGAPLGPLPDRDEPDRHGGDPERRLGGIAHRHLRRRLSGHERGDVGPLTEIFNGTSWSVVATPTPAGALRALNSVSAASSNAVWAVGVSVSVNSNEVSVSTPLVEHFNGTSWSIQTTPTLAGGGTLNAVTAISPTDVWAVGGRAPATHRALQRHELERRPGPRRQAWHRPWAESRRSRRHRHLRRRRRRKRQLPRTILQFNGTTWTAARQLPDRHCRTAVDAISATDVWTVGGRQHLELQRHDLDRGPHRGRPPDGHLGLLGQRYLRRRRGGPRRAVERHELERRLRPRARPGSPG